MYDISYEWEKGREKELNNVCRQGVETTGGGLSSLYDDGYFSSARETKIRE